MVGCGTLRKCSSCTNKRYCVCWSHQLQFKPQTHTPSIWRTPSALFHRKCSWLEFHFFPHFVLSTWFQAPVDDSPISEYHLWREEEAEYKDILEQIKNPFVICCLGELWHFSSVAFLSAHTLHTHIHWQLVQLLYSICIHSVWLFFLAWFDLNLRDRHIKAVRFVDCGRISSAHWNAKGKIWANKTKRRLHIDHHRLSNGI